jgi:transcriptional regulator with PAS, ATPase and Fis domain
MIGRSAAIRRIYDLIESVAPSDAPVILTGESGTGKEEAACAIHDLSRRSGPFLGVNCAAFTQTLIESEMFGHERGSFTGAQQKHEGFFEQANHGTLFLDEITELNLGLQAKMLRVLEERQLIRVGGIAPVRLDVRVIAATNRNLEAAISEGKMREDLYYRLNVFEIELPPLRKRIDDIQPLADHFVAEYNKRAGTDVEGMDAQCVAALKAYLWPGNVRELRNAIERAIIVKKRGFLSVGDLPSRILLVSGADDMEPFPFRVGMPLRKVEYEVIVRTVKSVGSLTRASKVLGISRTTLYKALEQHDSHGRNGYRVGHATPRARNGRL